jgi:hypothetical protein
MEKMPTRTATNVKGIAIGKEVKSMRKLGLPLALALIVSLASVAAAFDKPCDGQPRDDICYMK